MWRINKTHRLVYPNTGDYLQLIKDLKVKGTSVILKRGTLIKNIRLTSDEVKVLVLKTCFLKKC